jgi:hypothetical protein
MSENAICDVILVTAVKVHNNVFVPIERPIALPAQYLPTQSMTFGADFVGGVCPIIAVVYDYDRSKLVLVIGSTMSANAFNINEWLAHNPDWQLATGHGAEACTKCLQAISEGCAKIANWRAFVPDDPEAVPEILPYTKSSDGVTSDDDVDPDDGEPWTPFDD